jgi:hypothetical protein
VSGININSQGLGNTHTQDALFLLYTTIDYDLSELSIEQKEDLMQVD